MSSLIEDYQDRLDDLLQDAIGDDVDPLFLLLSAVKACMEEELEALGGESDEPLSVDFGDKMLTVKLETHEEIYEWWH
ncbi:TPA: hypothetical protein LTW58_001004 [Enterobacter hormaechei]|nr:hypothetical protein [Enterobacter hormaechei]